MRRRRDSARSEVERLFQQYPDFPREAIVKEDILTKGVSISQSISSVPGVVAIQDGPYELLRTVVRVIQRPESPYYLDLLEGRLGLRDSASGPVLASARSFPDDGGYGTQVSSSGAYMSDIVAPDGSVQVLPFCQLSPEEGCKFCALPIAAGVAGSSRGFEGRPMAEVVEALAALFHGIEWDPREKPPHLRIDGGTITSSLQNVPEQEFYLRYVRAIREALGNGLPLLLEMWPKPPEVEKRFEQAGADVRLCNLEVWDPDMFAAFCPGKARLLGWEEWNRMLIENVYVYGDGHVYSRFVVGLEMLKPWGSRTTDQTLKSLVHGINFMILHGVLPLLTHVNIDPRTPIGGCQQPPTELFLEADRLFYETWFRYRAPEPEGFHMGPGRNRFPDSAAFDMGRGAVLTRTPG